MRELDEDKINKLLTKPKTSSVRKPKENLNTAEMRNIRVWFGLHTKFDVCSNPACPDDRPRRCADGTAMCAIVEGVVMCRLCFLDKYGVGGVE